MNHSSFSSSAPVLSEPDALVHLSVRTLLTVALYLAIMAASYGIWWVGYEYGAHHHKSAKQDLLFWLRAPACALGTYLFTRRTGTHYIRQIALFAICCIPGACLLATATAFVRGVIPALTLTIMAANGANLGRMLATSQARLEKQR